VSGVGRRYAEALYSSLGGEAPDRILEDIETFAEWLRAVPQLKVTIENPGIPFARKVEILNGLARQGGFAELSIRFILLAATNRRMAQWEELVEAFRTLHYGRLGIRRAKVVSARAMSEERLTDLRDRLATIVGGPVEVEAAVSEALLGGLRLQIDSTVYDGSVSGALRSLRESLVKG
jgi:F-type H+-transporting ATPase subunit delta